MIFNQHINLIQKTFSCFIVTIVILFFQKQIFACPDAKYLACSVQDSTARVYIERDGQILSPAYDSICKPLVCKVAKQYDKILLKKGVYREFVQINREDLTLQSYSSNAQVVISGADEVSNNGWELCSGVECTSSNNIYKKQLDDAKDIFITDNSTSSQIMTIFARHPNTDSLISPPLYTAESASVGSITDEDSSVHPQINNYWNGASLWLISGPHFVAYNMSIDNHTYNNGKHIFFFIIQIIILTQHLQVG